MKKNKVEQRKIRKRKKMERKKGVNNLSGY